jgi:uncharacterized DUF497 family protein
MPFEWDEAKRESNLAKHRVDFVQVVRSFDGAVFETVDARRDYRETRIRCIGEIEGRVYVVVYTWRGDNRRIISARKANARETRTYRARYRLRSQTNARSHGLRSARRDDRRGYR